MNFNEAGRQYHALKTLLEKKDITGEQFQHMVEKIRAVAPDGRKWRIDPQTGNWVEGSISPSPGKPGAKSPESLLQLLVFLAKGLLKSVPRLIMVGLLMAVLTWAAHTYLIAKVNDGLMYQSGKAAVNSVVHLRETHFPGINAFWGLLAFFTSSFFMRARAQGLKNWVKNIKDLPKNIKGTVAENREKGVRIIVLGAFAALVFAFLYRNFMLSWVLAFGILLILAAHLSSLEILVMKVGLLDVQKMSRRNFVARGEEDQAIFLFLTGAFAGFLLAGIWRTQFYLTMVSGLLLLAFYVYISTRGLPRLAAVFLLVCGGILSLEAPVFAWCEGGSLSQAGGSWLEWWGSRNADVVRRLGLIPAGFSFAGGLLGSGLALLPDGGWTPPAAEEPPGDTPPPSPGRTRILDGDKALRWLESRELLENGVLTDRFWNDWHSYLGGDKGNPYGLGAVAGDWSIDNRDRPVGDLVIVVEEPSEVREVEPEPEIDPIPTIPPRRDPERIPPGDDKKGPPVVRVWDDQGAPSPPEKSDMDPGEGEREETPPVEGEKEAQSGEGEGQGPERDEYGMPVGVNPVDVFQDVMDQVLDEMKTRYWVMNPELRDSWLARLGYGDPSLVIKLLNNYVLNPLAGRLTDWKGGQCGEFAKWGSRLSRDLIGETFPGAFLDEIVLQRNPLMNHAATKVILPNGDRYVLDYWEGMQEGAPRVYTEQDWLNKWQDQLGGAPQIEHLGYLESRLRHLVAILGDTEEAIEMFLDDRDSPVARTIVQSYRRNPW